MTFLEWILSISLFTLYIACLFTVCVLTFRKGRYVLGVIGIFFPILWLIGAILPSKYGSSAWQDEEVRRQIASGN